MMVSTTSNFMFFVAGVGVTAIVFLIFHLTIYDKMWRQEREKNEYLQNLNSILRAEISGGMNDEKQKIN
ncbi:MAG: hypothetical protein ACRCWQ_06875 [Bacilli bacterium]